MTSMKYVAASLAVAGGVMLVGGAALCLAAVVAAYTARRSDTDE